MIAALATATDCTKTCAQISEFSLTSSPTSRVGHGQNRLFTEADGFTFRGSQDDGSLATVWVRGGLYGPWIMQFASPGSGPFPAPGAPPLTVGAYPHATRYPFHDVLSPGSAGLSFVGEGSGVNTLTGSFVILEFVPGAGSDLVSFAANFVQYDEGLPEDWNKGRIRFNSSVPLSVPEPGGATMAVASLLMLTSASANRRVPRLACPATE